MLKVKIFNFLKFENSKNYSVAFVAMKVFFQDQSLSS